jgi:hypothetical protein
MKEQSHKEEMSAALRGDFQRLRQRGVSAALVPHESEEPIEDETADDRPPEPPAEDPPERWSWLSRLAGR